MILVVKLNDDGADWDKIEGESAGERGSTVVLTSVRHGQFIGTGEVLGFKRDNRANQRLCRFAKNVEEA